MNGIPIRLERDTILEALFEIRFQPKQGFPGSIFPGLLYGQKETRDRYPLLEELPGAKVPAEIVEADPNLRYVATHRLRGEKYSVQVGAKSVALSCPSPYTGWIQFKSEILFLTSALLKTDLIERVERFSLRYINLLTHEEDVRGLQKLLLDIKAGGRDLTTDPLIALSHLRTELHDEGFINILQVASPMTAEVKSTGETKKGTLIDVDTIHALTEGEDFVKNQETMLESCHKEEKKMFFSLLKPDTVQSLGPSYEK